MDEQLLLKGVIAIAEQLESIKNAIDALTEAVRENTDTIAEIGTYLDSGDEPDDDDDGDVLEKMMV